MSKQDDVRRELLADFKATTRERIESISRGWLQLEKSPRDAETADALMRHLHSLKGEAKMMGFAELSNAAHHVESLVLATAKGGVPMTDALGDLVLSAADDLGHLLEMPAGGRDTAGLLAGLVQRIAALTGAQRSDEQAPDAPATPEHGAPASDEQRRGGDQFLRVNAEQFAALADLTSESVIAHGSYEIEARRLQEQLQRAVELGALAVRSPDVLGELRSLLADLAAAALSHYYRVYDGGLQARELEHLARRLRLIPIRGLLQTHLRSARDLARELGKAVSVEIDDRDTVIDKTVAERLSEPLLHLVRNSIDHGIESLELRKARSKPAEGKITMTAGQDGRWVTLVVSDDGGGVDYEAVKRRAVERGLVTPEAAATLNSDQAIALLFQSGFSTRQEVSETSGRGVGLDVVKRQVEAIGGRVRLTTIHEGGTRIELRVPATVALARVLVIEVGSELYALPSNTVEEVLDVDMEAVSLVRDRPMLRFRDGHVPLVPLGALLGNEDTATRRAVVMREDSTTVALGVPGWRGDVEVVVKPFGSFLVNTRLVTGACVLGETEVVPMLNPLELVTRAARQERVRLAHGEAANTEESKRILLVEDSSITRAMLARILRALGYEVVEAVDGEQGLATLHGRDVDLVLTDIDMPKMNGFQMVERIRAKKNWERLPILVLSTRGSAEDKRRAIDAGADGYLVKTEFSEEALRDLIDAKIG